MRLLSRMGSAVVMLTGVLVLLGWATGWEFCKQMLPGMVAMNPVTAVCFILAGGALWVLDGVERGADAVMTRRLAQGCAALVTLVGMVKLTGYLVGWDAPIDQLLFADRLVASGAGTPDRMAPNTALSLVMIGLSLVFLDWQVRRRHYPAQYLSLAVCGLGLLALAGYVFGLTAFYRIASLRPMALNTAIGFLLLSIGVLAARPGRGLARVVTSPTMGGLMMRRLLPAAVVAPLALGLVWKQGERTGILVPGFALPLTAVSSVALFAVVLYINANSLDQAERERRRAEKERNRFFSLSLDLFCIAGFDGYFKVLNDSWERTLGFTREELLASPYLDFIHPEDQPVTNDQAARNSQGQSAISFANRYRCKDGSYRWFLWNATPVIEEGLIYAVARDITEQKRVDDSIKELNETLRMRTVELEVLNKELEAFSYSVSHDLRAPVRHISGFVELLSKQDLGTDPKTQKYLRFVAESARQMGQLVDDLLSFSRMSRTEMTVGRVALGPLVSGVRGELAGSCANRAIDWRVSGLPEVFGDAAMLRLVFTNLLSNAIKYTGKEPRAEIEIGWKPNGVEEVIFVRDNGVGFDMRYVGKLFGVFQRLHRSDEFEGTGIGLANVRRIIHRHGGRTWAEGEVGKGATIYFSMPRKEMGGAEAKDIKTS